MRILQLGTSCRVNLKCETQSFLSISFIKIQADKKYAISLCVPHSFLLLPALFIQQCLKLLPTPYIPSSWPLWLKELAHLPDKQITTNINISISVLLFLSLCSWCSREIISKLLYVGLLARLASFPEIQFKTNKHNYFCYLLHTSNLLISNSSSNNEHSLARPWCYKPLM